MLPVFLKVWVLQKMLRCCKQWQWDLVNVIFTVVAIMTVDKWGRKPLLMVGSIGMAVGMFAIGVTFIYGNYRN